MYLLYPVNLRSLTFKWIEPFKFFCFQDKIFAVSRRLGQPSLTYASERKNTIYNTVSCFAFVYNLSVQSMLQIHKLC